MLISILCTVFTALVVAFQWWFIPKQYFKALNLLKKDEFSWELISTKQRHDRCVKKIWRAVFISGSLSLICCGLSFVDRLANWDLRFIAVVLAALIHFATFIPATFHAQRVAKENNIPVQERVIGGQMGYFDEGFLFICLAYSSGLLIYQILVLLFG